MKEKFRLNEKMLESVSGGSELLQKEEIRYGGADCPECESSNTEVHYQNGHTTYIKCFECGFEKS